MDDFAYNKVVLKVEDGTTVAGNSPCRTCQYGVKIRGVGNQVLRGCHSYAIAGEGMRIFPFEVAECNKYQDKSMPTLGEMEEIAWVVRSDQKKGGIGFFTPDENQKIERKKRGDDRL